MGYIYHIHSIKRTVNLRKMY